MLALAQTRVGQKAKIFPIFPHGRRVSLIRHHVKILQIVAVGLVFCFFFPLILEQQLGNCIVLIWYQRKVHCRDAVNSKPILAVQVDIPVHSHF